MPTAHTPTANSSDTTSLSNPNNKDSRATPKCTGISRLTKKPHENYKISTALATAALATTLLAPTAQALQPGDKYVALGDSYASTGTITQPVLGSTPACVKDQDNYPHQLTKLHNHPH